MNDADLAAELRALEERVQRNVPHRRDPERFHVEKSCIAQDLSRLADRFERGGAERPAVRPRAPQVVEYIAGRRVVIQTRRMPFAISAGTANQGEAVTRHRQTPK